MKKSTNIILASIFITILAGCEVKNTNIKVTQSKSINKNLKTIQNNNTASSKIEKQLPINLANKNKIILVKNEKDINNKLYNTIKYS